MTRLEAQGRAAYEETIKVQILTAVCSCIALAFTATAAEDAPPPPSPEIVVPVRVHLMRSTTDASMNTSLTERDVARIFEKVNRVWGQAGIRLEIESVVETRAAPLPPPEQPMPEHVRMKAAIPKEQLSATAVDICYVKEIRPNGFYYGEFIVVKDTARLREVPAGLDEPLPRVTSHELGHAFGLSHRQAITNLMASGTTGFSLNALEIAAAREGAAQPSSTPAPPAPCISGSPR